jgi:hypothetical protein
MPLPGHGRLLKTDPSLCGERACPALGCAAAPFQAMLSYLAHRGGWIRAAARPSAGQARSLQKPCASTRGQAPSHLCAFSYQADAVPGHGHLLKAAPSLCGERACPALGCEAAPFQAMLFYLAHLGGWIRAAARPSAGQACSLQKPCTFTEEGKPPPACVPGWHQLPRLMPLEGNGNAVL